MRNRRSDYSTLIMTVYMNEILFFQKFLYKYEKKESESENI